MFKSSLTCFEDEAEIVVQIFLLNSIPPSLETPLRTLAPQNQWHQKQLWTESRTFYSKNMLGYELGVGHRYILLGICNYNNPQQGFQK